MVNKEFLKLASSNLKKRKLRSSLTLLGIIISVMVIFLLISLSLGLKQGIEDLFNQMGRDKFFVYPMGIPGIMTSSDLTIRDINVIDKVSGVEKTFYATTDITEMTFKNKKRYLQTIGIIDDDNRVIDLLFDSFTLELKEGDFLKSQDNRKVVLGFKIPFIFEGIRIGDPVLINNQKFQVVGILESLGNDLDDSLLYISYSDSKNLFNNTENKIDFVGIKIKDIDDMDLVVEETKKRLDKYRNVTEDTRDYIIQTPEDILKIFNSILSVISIFLIGIGSISVLVGAVGIANTMYTSVLERTKEIGVMKAIGATNFSITKIFLFESGLLGLIGGIIGMFVGFLFAELISYLILNFANISYLKPIYPLYLIIGVLIFSVLIGIISGFLPSKNASRTNIVNALRYE
ncbi:MAG: FtsX-like permease family protein [Candidatus Pacearchaeota archaeon]